jgi:NAD(P)-dependent dehydrogenase (short-subunit alcohol dehydrogenase family)
MNAQRIEGAVALLTGAHRGIGRALTEALLARRVRRVYATARNPEALRTLHDERLVLLQLDVTDEDEIRCGTSRKLRSSADIFMAMMVYITTYDLPEYE